MSRLWARPVQDKLCDRTKWHKRDVPRDPARDPYFPIGQASMTLTTDGKSIRVSLKTLTPNFKTYLVRIDNRDWKPAGETLTWNPRSGTNRLEAKSVNQYGVEGPASTAEVRIEPITPQK